LSQPAPLVRENPATIELAAAEVGSGILNQFRQSLPKPQIIIHGQLRRCWAGYEPMDKIAGLKEILALDSKNSFARYGIAMELAARGDAAGALAEFDTLLANDPDYTAGYFMSAQTLVKAGLTAEAVTRLKAGIGCAARSGNSHALSEMQGMLDELDR
jgi:thioredoxin-like negative regulator of GroEL